MFSGDTEDFSAGEWLTRIREYWQDRIDPWLAHFLEAAESADKRKDLEDRSIPAEQGRAVAEQAHDSDA